MTTAINWPPTLPTRSDDVAYGEDYGVLLAVTPMDAGPAKIRRRGNKPDIITASYSLTPAQLDTLEAFVKTTLMGVKRFNWTHPRKQTAVEVRLVPDSSGKFYSVAYLTPTVWRVSLQFEILP